MHDFLTSMLVTEEAMDLDRAYFESHPEAGRYFRRALKGEFGTVLRPKPGNELWVEVRQMGPGARMRITYEVAK